jgi:predicted phosphoribosyltransferase
MAQLRIVSRSEEVFRDRQEAGRLLARELDNWRGQGAVVLGIPRGGIIVARELARAIEADLDIVLAHKLRTPDQPELAMGAVAEDGKLFLNERLVQDLGIKSTDIQEEKRQQQIEITRRAELIRHILPRIPLEGRLVIVTDDGVATGATTLAALWAVRQEHPEKLIAATPVGSETTVRKLAEEADEMICLRAPRFFAAIGQFYMRFDQVEDEEVLKILEEERDRRQTRML